ncbi:menaquinol-cytochrome C reductase [Nakamurella antarctica]|uniref:Cytochrome bc1 complex Rieske iron-sulfur subunit n=1 Tax=Nakamurella antarctica TaxID=1902245 RepID=A0A3G8ZKD2_9ACTN|nr:Rieske 2Fe-2S domain-containing protein [Nakamurella antarctica]AZI57779.1 menaquinol-cytochrome C reductase [Nakamurella antarctica]
MSGGQDVVIPSAEEMNAMSREDLARLGARLDGVELVEYGERYEPGSPADKRAERSVARWFLLAAVSAVAFVVVFIAWPWQYETAYSDKQWVYALYNPLIGLLLGLTIFALGIGVIAMAKKIAPHEVAIQQRHVGMSDEVDRRTMVAELADTGIKMGLKRRGVLKGSLALAGAGLGVAAVVPVLGGFIKNPWDKGDKSDLWVTPWAPLADGSLVRMAYQDGTLVRPEDLAAGSMTTVFPAVPGGAKASDAAVMLFRLRANDPIKFRAPKYETFRYGDFYAYSKICTHVGCPVSLYEQQTGRVLCPCHQSQFDINDGAKPVFGPAARALPQLPLGVDKDGHFVAMSDFIEPVGPGFWENSGKHE